VVEAVVLGAAGFIIKPFNEKTLVEAIRNLL
jgi:FixJ family two-component response regulator